MMFRTSSLLSFSSAIFFVLAATCSISAVYAARSVLEVHGSGTTNPSKCLWMLMDQFMDRAKVPIRMTYRAVGSSTGIKEFVGVNNTEPFSYKNYNDFGAGDIPVPSSDYEALDAKGVEFVHLPFVLGSVGVFLYDLFGSDDIVEDKDQTSRQTNVNLTGCNLAKIFKRDIVHWDDPEILQDNPQLKTILPYENVFIHVARRVHGSSSTKSLTSYLHMVCPDVWPKSMVGSKIDWPEDTLLCEGSAGMTECVKSTPGAIGYMESGHGWQENLVEVELQNKAGRFLTSETAAKSGGIGGAAGDIPGSADDDFGRVNLLNKDGDKTWPITLMSYIFVRKDLSFLRNLQEQSLLTAFLRSLYDEDNINQCKQFGFSPVPENVRDIALAGIDMLQVNNTAEEWIIEKKTMPGVGQGEYVISHKRRDYMEYVVNENADDIRSIVDAINGLNEQVGSVKSQTARAQAATATQFTTQDQSMIRAALAMSSISIILWGVTAIALVTKRLFGC